MAVVENLPPTNQSKSKAPDNTGAGAELHQGSADFAKKRSHTIVNIIAAVGDGDIIFLRQLIHGLHPADIASILADIPETAARIFIRLIGEELDSEVFAELDEDTKELVLEVLPTKAVARALEDLDSDDAVAFIEELDEAERAEVLAQTSDEVRASIEGGLSFEEDTAGRLMQREFVAAPEFWNVGRTIDHMRATGEDLPDLFFEIYVVDPAFRPIGAVAVSKLMRAPRGVPLKGLMENIHVIIRPENDQEDVAYSFQKYHLISAPVVDEGGRLTGMITVDDMVQVLQEENQEDLLALAGVSDASTTDDVWSSMVARLPWLVINLVTALTSSFFISKFSGLISQIVALAVLMPMVASLGGNAGTQTLAVAVRALSARELNRNNAMKVVFREAMTGVLNGLVIATVLATVAGLWFHNPTISLTIGLAVTMNFVAAGLAGILVPLTLEKFGQDPAVSSGVIVTFVTDMVGFVAFLGLATLIVSQ